MLSQRQVGIFFLKKKKLLHVCLPSLIDSSSFPCYSRTWLKLLGSWGFLDIAVSCSDSIRWWLQDTIMDGVTAVYSLSHILTPYSRPNISNPSTFSSGLGPPRKLMMIRTILDFWFKSFKYGMVHGHLKNCLNKNIFLTNLMEMLWI